MSTCSDADRRLLALANEKGKFAIQIGCPMDEALQAAFERGIDNEWFTLVDIAPLAHADGRVCRVFRLTETGKRWRKALSR